MFNGDMRCDVVVVFDNVVDTFFCQFQILPDLDALDVTEEVDVSLSTINVFTTVVVIVVTELDGIDVNGGDSTTSNVVVVEFD